MSVNVIETTIQKTYDWLNDLRYLLKWRNEERAYLALKGTLHALRDRLPVDLAAKFSAQLPMLIRGLYFEGWRPAATPIKVKTLDEFLDLAAAHFNNASLAQDDVEEIVRCVFQLIASHVSSGEVERLRQALPLPIAELWPSPEFSQYLELERREMRHAPKMRY